MASISREVNVNDELLTWGVEQRKLYISKLLKTNGDLPDDPKEIALLFKALDGIDKTAISRMRIKIEDKAATSQAEVAKIIAQVYQSIAEKNPYVIDQSMAEVSNTPRRAAPQLPDYIGDPETIEGEMAMSPAQGSYEQFMQSMGKNPV